VICLSFGACNLELIWDLEFVICLSFGACNLELIWGLEFVICLSFGAWDLEFVIWDSIDTSTCICAFAMFPKGCPHRWLGPAIQILEGFSS